MFEDQPTPPANLPTGGGEPEDMFESVEPVQTPPRTEFQPGKPAPKAAPVSPAPPSVVSTPHPSPLPQGERGVGGSSPLPQGERGVEGVNPAQIKGPLIASRKVIVVAGVILGALVIAGIAVVVTRFARNAAQVGERPAPAPTTLPLPDIPSLPTVPQDALIEVPGLPAPASLPEQQQSGAALENQDLDGDGLSDSEESAAGTDPATPDSDNDGLFDGEELQTYRTDPLDPDTDGDGFLDGQEVRSGYDPNGTGKLFTVPSQ